MRLLARVLRDEAKPVAAVVLAMLLIAASSLAYMAENQAQLRSSAAFPPPCTGRSRR
jgi:Spy/CpxP family protein refolding chaperone